jgi:lysylphosphatidylglycerol synthetase-like protein (DUF2156 family)
VEVRELAPADVPLEEVQRISSLWLLGKRVRNRELRFLTRPPEFQGGNDVRRFYCFLKGRLVGYVFLDPFFRGGRVLGYCANILRCEPGLRPQGILDFALLQALEQFRGEGIQTLSLGIAPLHGLAPCSGESRLLRWFGQALYRWGGTLYNFRELAFHKARFRGEASKVYFCKRGIGCLGAAALSLQATNLLPDWAVP